MPVVEAVAGRVQQARVMRRQVMEAVASRFPAYVSVGGPPPSLLLLRQLGHPDVIRAPPLSHAPSPMLGHHPLVMPPLVMSPLSHAPPPPRCSYDVSDSAGNRAATAMRRVVVVCGPGEKVCSNGDGTTLSCSLYGVCVGQAAAPSRCGSYLLWPACARGPAYSERACSVLTLFKNTNNSNNNSFGV